MYENLARFPEKACHFLQFCFYQNTFLLDLAGIVSLFGAFRLAQALQN
jgi:hypothetical protein